jgi:hypothetical protein
MMAAMSVSYKTSGPVTLTETQIQALHQQLRAMRHDVNGRLTSIVVAAELIRRHPETAAEPLQLLQQEPGKIAETLAQFSRQFETSLRLGRG